MVGNVGKHFYLPIINANDIAKLLVKTFSAYVKYTYNFAIKLSQ